MRSRGYLLKQMFTSGIYEYPVCLLNVAVGMNAKGNISRFIGIDSYNLTLRRRIKIHFGLFPRDVRSVAGPLGGQ